MSHRPDIKLVASAAAFAVATVAFTLAAGAGANAPAMPEHRTIRFPVEEKVSYVDTFGACRGTNCSRRHMGQDLIGLRLDHLLAATDATVVWKRTDATGLSGNDIQLKDAAGWSYWYMHINNDTPGTDDGLNPPLYQFAPGINVGTKVKAGQFIAYMGDSGDAEYSVPHLHFEIRRPDGTAINAFASLRLAQGLSVNSVWCGAGSNPTPAPKPASAKGLLVVDKLGTVQALGAAKNLGDTSKLTLWGAMLGVRRTSTSKGYYLIARDGGVFTYGDAKFFGSTGGMRLNAPIAGITPTPTGRGYWLFADDGGIFSFGDARFHGSGFTKLGSSIAVGMTATPTGRGYWIAASDGRVLNFGDAPAAPTKSGATSNVRGIVATHSGGGFWLIADNGTIATAGDAVTYGSPARSGLCNVNGSMAMTASATGAGYWVAEQNGTILNFGDAVDFGNAHLKSTVVGIDQVQ